MHFDVELVALGREVALQQPLVLLAVNLLVDAAEEALQAHLALQLHQSVEHRLGTGRAARDVDVDGQDFVDALDHVVGLLEGSAADGAAPHGNHILGVGHLVVEALEHRGHLVGDGAGHHDEVGLTRGGAGHFKPEPGKIVARGAHGHELDAAAARGERQRPEAVAATPLNHIVEASHHDVGAVAAQLLHHPLEVFVVVEILVAHRLYLRLPYFHSSAPFRQA